MSISTQSLIRSRWQHPADPPGPARYVRERFGVRFQEARVLGLPARSVARPRLVAVHGAGADYTQLNPLLYGLQQRGVGSLAMNLSGHGEATGGSPARTSLGGNAREALRFGERLRPGLLAVLSVDLGAMAALRLAQSHVQSIHRMVFVDPCLYPDEAGSRPLSVVLSCPPLRWNRSSLLGFVKGFLGQVMVITGEDPPVPLPSRRVERVEPANPAEAIVRSVHPRRVSRLVVEGCAGPVMPWLHQHPDAADRTAAHLADFLGPT